ncbi:MAG: adenylate kinase [Candidatus Altiarchaeota archaeon]
MTTAILTGIPGSGKTTVLTKALEMLAEKDISYKHVVYGTVMFEIAKEKGLVANRDEMRKLPVKSQKEVQLEAAGKIGDLGEKENIIVDTHCTVKTPKGFIPGLPSDVLAKINPSLIIIVETDPAKIVARREKDKSRARDEETVEDLALHQNMNRAFSAAYALQSKASLKVVENREGRLDEAAKELAEVLEWSS